MQSQLEAALLGHSTCQDEEENNFQEEEADDTEEFEEV